MEIRHSVKRNIVTKLLLALMPAWLALTPHSVLAHDGATGSSTTANTTLNNGWQTVLRSTVNNQFGNTHYCTVVGSADFQHRSGNGRYLFGISLNGANPASSVTRTVDLNNNPGVDDPNFMEVSSTAFIRIPAGVHTFHLRARRVFGGSARVDDASMTVNCFNVNHGFVITAPLGSSDIESAN